MSITISISEKTEKRIRQQAAKTGQNVDTVVGNLLEEIWDERFPEESPEMDASKFENPFDQFIGMFASGKTDTSIRAKKILLEDVKVPGGWGGQ